MLKKILSLFVMLVLAAGGLKGYLTYQAYTAMEEIKSEYVGSFSINYDWLSVGFDGNVSFENMSVTSFLLKRTLSMDAVNFHLGGLGAVMDEMAGFKKRSSALETKIEIIGATAELKGKELSEWVSDQYGSQWLVPSALYACGEYQRMNHRVLPKVGINKLKFDAVVSNKRRDDKEIFSIDWRGEQLGQIRFAIQKEISNSQSLLGSFISLLNLDDVKSWASVDFNYRDNGFIRRVRNFCDVNDTGVFPEIASLQWRQALRKIGVLVDDKTQAVYRDYLQQGGVFAMQINEPSKLVIDAIVDLTGKSIAEYIDMRISVNKQNKEGMLIELDYDHFKPVVDDSTLKNTINGEDKAYKPAYRVTAYSELDNYLDKRIRLETQDGKSFEGVLKSVNERQMEVLVNVAGGTVTYNIKPHGIDRLEVWR